MKYCVQMEWYNYIAVFFAGMFLSNAVPHFIHGISGDKFPTPFASPPGRGLSSPMINILWAAFNVLAGVILFRASKYQAGNEVAGMVLFAGALAMSIVLSKVFTKKHKE